MGIGEGEAEVIQEFRFHFLKFQRPKLKVQRGNKIYLNFALWSLLFDSNVSSNKIPTTPLHPKKLSVPLQAILGYKSTGLLKTK
jgi:hypothetical protein